MVIADRIMAHVKELPPSLQAEVLDFVKFLLTRQKRETAEQEDREETPLSLALAMRGMEDEETPEYTIEDLEEVF